MVSEQECDRAHCAFELGAPQLGLTSSAVRRFWPAQRRRGTAGLGTMHYLLLLLVAVTMACGAAATVTIELAPAYADASATGY
jgi:hypothetical protein